MNNSKKLTALLGAALLAFSVATPAQALSGTESGWADYSVTSSLASNVMEITLTIDITNHIAGHALVWQPATPSAGEVKVDPMFNFCGAFPNTNCTSVSWASTTVTTSSSTVMTYVGRLSNWSQTLPFHSSQPDHVLKVTLQKAGSPSPEFKNIFVLLNSGGSGSSDAPAPAPAKYAGPEFSSLSLKPVMHGSSATLTGKRLTQVNSIEIGGKAATFTAVSDTELSLTPAADLAPGTYDLVINSAAGKLTHMNAIQVRESRRAFSITTRSEGRISEEQYQEHATISSMQIPELNKARCIVNGSNLALAKAQAERLCALVAAANPNIETTVVEPRSTVKNNTVFARVTYGWN
jgi:hypothetical protein